MIFIEDTANKDRQKNVPSAANIKETTIISMSGIFPLVTDPYRSAEAVNENVKSIPAILT